MEDNFENNKKSNSFFKISVFQVFDALLENNTISFIMFFIVHLIEFFQILAFGFSPIFTHFWTNKEMFITVSSFLQNSWINYIFNIYVNWGNYTIIFFIYILINLLILIDFFYILICLKKNYEIWTFARIFLQFFSNIFIPVLFIPMLDTFVLIFNCKSDETGYITNNIFDSLECFGSSIIFNLLSVLGMVLIFAYSYLLSTLFYDSNPSGRNIKARFICSYEKSMFVSKTILVLVFQFSTFLIKSREWICNIINIFCSMINFIFLIKQKPYFDPRVLKILLIFRNIELLTSLILTLSMIITDYDGDFILFFIGAALVIWFHYVFPENKHDIIILNDDNIRDDYILQKKLNSIIELIDNRDKLENELFIKGFLSTQNNEEAKSLAAINSSINKNKAKISI
jgi:hypothetical protein